MKNIIIVIFLVSFISCNKGIDSKLLIGHWEIDEITDVKSNEPAWSEYKDLKFNFTKDSIFSSIPSKSITYDGASWTLSENTLTITSHDTLNQDYKIITLTESTLEVEFDNFFDSLHVQLVKNKAVNKN